MLFQPLINPLILHKKWGRFVAFVALALALVLLAVILYPRTYGMPEFETRPATQYWKMSNGSSIGFTVLSKRMEKKPYPVIYLHGGPGGYIRKRHIEALSPLADSGFRVYLYDQVGSGHSDRLNDISDYTVQRHVDDLREIIMKIGAPKVILIGQSWGSILATLFAVQYPSLVHQIVLTSPGPIFPVLSDLEFLPAPDSIRLTPPVYSNEMGNRQGNNWRTKAMKWMAIHLGLKLAPDREADQFATYLSQVVNRSTVCDTTLILPAEPGGGYYAAVMTFNSLLKIEDPRPRIQTLKMPVLVLKGECDNQKWGYTQEYLELFSNSSLKFIPGAGHFLEVEQPDLYIRSIMDFLLPSM